MSYQLQEINAPHPTRTRTAFWRSATPQYAKKVEPGGRTPSLANLNVSPIVLLSGPSGSGKTTTAMKIEEELERRGVQTHTISMDNYFKTLNPKTAPRTAGGGHRL